MNPIQDQISGDFTIQSISKAKWLLGSQRDSEKDNKNVSRNNRSAEIQIIHKGSVRNK